MSEHVMNELAPGELIAHLEQKQNITISRGTLQRWTRAGLVPEPRTGSYGRGGGRFTLYPERAVAETAASWCTLRLPGLRPTVAFVAEARRKALDAHRVYVKEASKWSAEQFRKAYSEGFDDQFDDDTISNLAHEWLIAFLKARMQFSIHERATVGYQYEKLKTPPVLVLGPPMMAEIKGKEVKQPVDGLIHRYVGEVGELVNDLKQR